MKLIDNIKVTCCILFQSPSAIFYDNQVFLITGRYAESLHSAPYYRSD